LNTDVIIRSVSRTCAALLACGLLSAPALAQYPTRPIRLIIPFPPGGGTDVLGRALSQKLSDSLKQQVVMDNRPGAGANIGTELAARSSPDGYTLLMSTISQSISASLYPKLGYDLVRDFAPISLVANQPLMLAVHPTSSARSVKDVIAMAQAKPDTLTFSSAGNGTATHLAAELFKHMTQVRIQHVPYKGGGPAVIAIISGEVSAAIASLPSVMPHVKSGKLRGIAVSSAKRSVTAPDYPTIAESGVPGYDASAWYGLTAPARTPPEIVNRLVGEVHRVLALPEIRQLYDNTGFEILSSTPGEFAAFVQADIRKWATVVKAAGVRAD
jgi:tripartite-type tricarboxylate transporter receptor subunit TctC